MSITSRLRGCAAVWGCTAARQPCTAVRKRCTAARLRAAVQAVRDGCAETAAQAVVLPLTLVQAETLHSLTRTHGGGPAQAAARPGAPPGASALIASAAIA